MNGMMVTVKECVEERFRINNIIIGTAFLRHHEECSGLGDGEESEGQDWRSYMLYDYYVHFQVTLFFYRA